MSTRSLIGKELEDGRIECIYCHHDGYPEHHINILTTSYNTEEKINRLFELGDISNLRDTTEDIEAYHRDRGEDFESTRSEIITDYEKRGRQRGVDYIYTFNKNQSWTYEKVY